MVICPECGEEYSLGRKIYHSCCSEFSIYHGIVCSEKCEERPWNCSSNKRPIKQKRKKSSRFAIFYLFSNLFVKER